MSLDGAQVVVSGMGIITSIGIGVDEFALSLRSGRNGISYNPHDGLGVAARLSRFDFEQCLTALSLPEAVFLRARKVCRKLPMPVQVAVIAVLEAWQQAFGQSAAYTPEDIGIVVAGHNINQHYQHATREKYREHAELVPASYALHFMDSDAIGVISEILAIHGEGWLVGAASASGNIGIAQGYRQVKSGVCQACIVMGSMADLSAIELQAFRNAGALGGADYLDRPEQASRPFDQKHNGFIYGQGCGCLILESASAAESRGAVVLGEIAGVGLCLDGNRLSDPSISGEARAMRLALKEAGLDPCDVDYVNSHGSGSILGDETEVKALKTLFGAHIQRVRLNATKGLTGHCLYAAGAIEAIATLIQMQQGFLHPNRNLENPIDNEIQFVGTGAIADNVQVALNNSFGFGGINSCVVIKH
jgi:malonyl-ACP decarboxylase